MSAVNQQRSEAIKKIGILPWIVCFSASLFFAYELLQLHVMNALAPMLMQDLELNATQFGTLSSTYLLADIIFLLPAGILLDRFSVRKVILVALFLCIMGTMGFCQAHSFSFACFCHFLSGIGNAFCFLSCMMLISRWFPKEKHAFVMGLMITMGMLGGVMAQLPFSLLAQNYDWRSALFIDGLIGIGVFALIFAFVKDAPKGSTNIESEKGLPFWTGIKRSVLNIHNICCGVYTGFMNMPLMVISAVWGTLFLTQVHQITLVKSSFIVSMVCMGTIVGSPLFGWFSDRLHKRLVPMIFGGIASTFVMLLIMFASEPSEGVLVILFFALGVFTSSQVLGYPAITENNPPELTGTSMGIAALIIMGMPAFIQPLTGKLLDKGWDGTLLNGAPLYSSNDFVTAFSVFPIGFLLALIALLKIKRSKSNQEASLRTKEA